MATKSQSTSAAKKTLLPYASAADWDYAVAHPDRYNPPPFPRPAAAAPKKKVLAPARPERHEGQGGTVGRGGSSGGAMSAADQLAAAARRAGRGQRIRPETQFIQLLTSGGYGAVRPARTYGRGSPSQAEVPEPEVPGLGTATAGATVRQAGTPSQVLGSLATSLGPAAEQISSALGRGLRPGVEAVRGLGDLWYQMFPESPGGPGAANDRFARGRERRAAEIAALPRTGLQATVATPETLAANRGWSGRGRTPAQIAWASRYTAQAFAEYEASPKTLLDATRFLPDAISIEVASEIFHLFGLDNAQDFLLAYDYTELEPGHFVRNDRTTVVSGSGGAPYVVRGRSGRSGGGGGGAGAGGGRDANGLLNWVIGL